MIRCIDSHEWVEVSYVLRHAWTPLIDSSDDYDTVNAIFRSNGRVIKGSEDEPFIEILGAKTVPRINFEYSYKIRHSVIVDDGLGGVKELLHQLWGTITAVIHKDHRSNETLLIEVDDIRKV